ncbi:MAG: FAD assembly factor SdhE [Alphaproteobacteria bacterium]
MTGTNRTSAGLDNRHKRVLFRAWHRGTRELDLLLGGYADRHIATMKDADLAAFETLMDVPDTQLYDWLIGSAPVPANHDTPLFRGLLAWHEERGGAARP